jgi:hypothetical protein
MTRAKAVELAGQMLFASATDRGVRVGDVRPDPRRRDGPHRAAVGDPPRLAGPRRLDPEPVHVRPPVTFDGESTFRLTKVTYSAQDDTATLELDGGARHLFKGAGPALASISRHGRRVLERAATDRSTDHEGARWRCLGRAI